MSVFKTGDCSGMSVENGLFFAPRFSFLCMDQNSLKKQRVSFMYNQGNRQK